MSVQSVIYRKTTGPSLAEREGSVGTDVENYVCDLMIAGNVSGGFTLAPSLFSNTYDSFVDFADAKVNIGYPCYVDVYNSFFDLEIYSPASAGQWSNANFCLALFVGDNSTNIWTVGGKSLWCYDHTSMVNGGSSDKYRVELPDIFKVYLFRGTAVQVLVSFNGLSGGAGVNINWHIPYSITRAKI